jgi:hypothetical protein
MKLTVLDDTFAVARLTANSNVPSWALKGPFFSIGKTEDELSIVCRQNLIPGDVKMEKDWKIIKVEGPLDFGLTGILASIANPLAEAKISIFAISTFDTDYVMVKNENLVRALKALEGAGFVFE